MIWKNKIWTVEYKSQEGGNLLTIRKKGIKVHSEFIAHGADENVPLSIPQYVMTAVLNLMIKAEKAAQ